MIGRPGCSVFQMSGQPAAQNTRETGADGDFVGMRNWQNPEHVAELAAAWNLDPLQIPSWAPPTHVMQMFRYAEEGSIRFLWISATNPAVSLPELHRIRSILSQDRLFVVVTDAFLTETAQLADVVLPAAIWGEKTGTFTNHDRTVHLSEKAVEPPGQARPDMEIFLDYARRLELTDKDLRRLAPFADRHGASGGGRSVADSTGVVETVRRRSGDLLGRSKASGLLLLKDLRALYLSVQAAEIAWVILVQAAKAARDSELLDTASSCHQEAETRGKWLRTRIKEASPQVLVAG